MKYIFLILLVAFVGSDLFSQNTYSFNNLEKKITDLIEEHEIPSLVVAIAKDGNIIYEKAFGFSDIENKIKASTSTSYQLASVSKPITATGVMILQHKKYIDINTSAEKYITPLKFNAFEGVSSSVKVVDLLNHTSGLGSYFQLSYSDEDAKADNFETAFSKYGNLVLPSGVICEYSNLGYGLLDYLISKQSGKTFSKFMESELFKPLGMNHSFVDSSSNSNLIIAKKYDSDLNLLPMVNNNTAGAGNVYASIHDLALFGMFHLGNYGTEILDKAELDLMHNYINPNTLYPSYDSAFYGLGWFFNYNEKGQKLIWHEGGMTGASSMIKLIPEENIVITVILNTFNQELCQEITDDFSKIVLPEYKPILLNPSAEYKKYTTDSTFFGNWQGAIKVGELDIPCTLEIQSDGNIIIDYLDYTYVPFLTLNTPIPYKTFLLYGQVNKNSFVGAYLGDLPSDDIRHEHSQLMNVNLYKDGDVLSGFILAIPAAEKMYYSYPYYIRLERKI